MATSEFLKDAGKRNNLHVPEEQRLRGKSIAGVPLAAPALRMLHDAMLIAIAAVLSILIRLLLLHDFKSYWGTGTGFSGSGIFYLAWFILCYTLVARRYGLYAPVPLRNGAHETRLIAQAAVTAALFLCGAIYMTHNFISSRLLIMVFGEFHRWLSVMYRTMNRVNAFRS